MTSSVKLNPTKEEAFNKKVNEILAIAADETRFDAFVEDDLLIQPHSFITAMTGSGKSFFIMRMIMDLIRMAGSRFGNPLNVSFRIIDPKYIKGDSPWGILESLPMGFFDAEDTFDYGESQSDPILTVLDSGELYTVIAAIERLDMVIDKINGRKRAGKPQGGYTYDVTFFDEWMEALAIAAQLDQTIKTVKEQHKEKKDTNEFIPTPRFREMLKQRMSYIARIGRAVKCFLVLVSQTTNVEENGFAGMGGSQMRHQFQILSLARGGRNGALKDVIGSDWLFKPSESSDRAALSKAADVLSKEEKKRKTLAPDTYTERGLMFTTHDNGSIFAIPNISGSIEAFSEAVKKSNSYRNITATDAFIERNEFGSDKPLNHWKRLGLGMMYHIDEKYDASIEGEESLLGYFNEQKKKRQKKKKTL